MSPLSHAGSLSPVVNQNHNMILLHFDWKVDPVYYQQAVLLSHIPKDFVSVNKRKWDVAQLTNFLKWLVHYIFSVSKQEKKCLSNMTVGLNIVVGLVCWLFDCLMEFMCF